MVFDRFVVVVFLLKFGFILKKICIIVIVLMWIFVGFFNFLFFIVVEFVVIGNDIVCREMNYFELMFLD